MIILNAAMLGSGGLALCCMLASRERSVTAWALHVAMTMSMVLCVLPGARPSLVGLAAVLSAVTGAVALWRWRRKTSERHPMLLHRALSSLLMAGAVVAHVGLNLIAGGAGDHGLAISKTHAGHSGSGGAQLLVFAVLLIVSFMIYTAYVVHTEMRSSTRSRPRIGEVAAMGLGVIVMSIMPVMMLSA